MSCFGERLRTVIADRGITQGELATAAGTYPANMSQWINGTISPTVPSLRKILTALPDVDARWLITGEPQ